MLLSRLTQLASYLSPGLFQSSTPHYREVSETFSLRGTSRSITTQSHAFEGEDHPKAIHYTAQAEAGDNVQDVEKHLRDIIKTHPETLLFLTEKSQILAKRQGGGMLYTPLKSEEFTDIPLMINLLENRLLFPHPGHVCMTMIDGHGAPIDKTTISLRPRRDALVLSEGQLLLYPKLYPSMEGGLRMASHTSTETEISAIAGTLVRGRAYGYQADLSFVSLSGMLPEQFIALEENIATARKIPLYNLCALLVNKMAMDSVTDEDIKQCINQLAAEAQEFKVFRDLSQDDTKMILAGMACTHAVAKAVYGDARAVERIIGPDHDTQALVTYCIMGLVGSDRFLSFAKKIGFYDNTSEMLRDSDNAQPGSRIM